MSIQNKSGGKGVPKTISGKTRRIELRDNEVQRKQDRESRKTNEFFCQDFLELSSKLKN